MAIAHDALASPENIEIPQVGVQQQQDPSSTPQYVEPGSSKVYQPVVFNDEFDKLLAAMFARYDLDDSQTINSSEEFRMLTTNMVFKLQLTTVEDFRTVLDDVLDAVDYSEEYSIEQYKDWFIQHQARFFQS